MSLKNKWRKRGSIQFRRETRRLSDGTPDGDVLFVRVKGKACVFAILAPSFPYNRVELWGNDGLYFRPNSAVECGRRLYKELKRRAANPRDGHDLFKASDTREYLK